ncbi:protein N-terminal asparagine amidohydrolase isoform X4 [Herrania umbratica]|uniref:Protein N-terminal asparagine amidohydrolase isoform X4 n=1 Tax=Herrania umbratica TaxID=108875 RepID=A0A6J1A304_9ROSI|nr:protein N-terminal asparagine amidohydrolase isoform X4 [Herrania umbratica]
MIFVGGLPFSSNSSSSSSAPSSQSQPMNLLMALMEHPILVSASHSFKSIQERRVSASMDSDLTMSSNNPKYVYLFQREYATVDPALVHVHLVGGFEDVSPNHAKGICGPEGNERMDGYSFPLCTKIVETLQKRQENFHVQTLCVLGHNTKTDSQGNAYPIFSGFLVESSTGSLIPASFDRNSQCPDEIVRRLRVSASYEDPSWHGKLLDTYDTKTDRFIIAPCSWTICLVQIALSLQNLSDSEILSTCSTSPSAEGPDFVDNERRLWNYLIKHPDWKKTFPMRQPRVFERTADGGWKRADSQHLVKDIGYES